MKNVLVIKESPLLANFFKQKLKDFNIEISFAADCYEGWRKARTSRPDLIVLSNVQANFQFSAIDLLKHKMNNPGTKDIPVIMLVGNISVKMLSVLARYKIIKFFSQPLKMEELVSYLSDFFNISISFDKTPCIADAYFNDGILFVDLGVGFNTERLELLRFKILEILTLFQIEEPRIFLLVTNIADTEHIDEKMHHFLKLVQKATQSPLEKLSLITSDKKIVDVVNSLPEFGGISTFENIKEAVDHLSGVDKSWPHPDSSRVERQSAVKSETFAETEPVYFEEGMGQRKLAVVDDDPVTRELVRTAFINTAYTVTTYENGKQFMESLNDNQPDLVFLDLLMPEKDGFTVLAELTENKIEIPVVVLTVVKRKEAVIKARFLGVKSYLVKPLAPDQLRKKANEILELSI